MEIGPAEADLLINRPSPADLLLLQIGLSWADPVRLILMSTPLDIFALGPLIFPALPLSRH